MIIFIKEDGTLKKELYTIMVLKQNRDPKSTENHSFIYLCIVTITSDRLDKKIIKTKHVKFFLKEGILSFMEKFHNFKTERLNS